MTRQETTATLAKNHVNNQRFGGMPHATDRDIDKVLMFDHGRLGDIVIELDDCTETIRLLGSRWGRTKMSLMNELIWENQSSEWVADVVVPQHGSSCVFTFTSSAFFGPKPNAWLARLEPGTSRHNASLIDPDLAKATASIPVPGISEAIQGVTFRGDQVENTYVLLPARAIIALRRAWANGVTFDGGTRTVWFDAASGRRATLEGTQLVFDKPMGWEDWLGDGPILKALGPVLGAPIGELRRDRGNALVEGYEPHDPSKRTSYSLRIPSAPWDRGSSSTASLYVERDVVTSAELMLLYTTPTVRDRMVRQFEMKWGPKTATKVGFDFRSASTIIHVIDYGTELQLNMTEILPRKR